MSTYYFTFGTNQKFPHYQGYISIEADSYAQSREYFGIIYPQRINGFLPFSFQYTQEEWDRIQDWLKGLHHKHYSKEYCEQLIRELSGDD